MMKIVRVFRIVACVELSTLSLLSCVAGSCVSDEESAFLRRGVERIQMIPGSPESDAVRFYSSTQRNEYVEFNYDESKAGALGRDYVLEDPLVFADARSEIVIDDAEVLRDGKKMSQ